MSLALHITIIPPMQLALQVNFLIANRRQYTVLQLILSSENLRISPTLSRNNREDPKS